MGDATNPSSVSSARYWASRSACLTPRSWRTGSAGPSASTMRTGSAWRMRRRSTGSAPLAQHRFEFPHRLAGVGHEDAGQTGLARRLDVARSVVQEDRPLRLDPAQLVEGEV